MEYELWREWDTVNGKFIRLERFNKFVRWTLFFIYLVPFLPFVLSFRYITVSNFLILRFTSFIPWNQSCARCYNRISKFLEEDGGSRRQRTNEDERLNATFQENTMECDSNRENKIYLMQNALRVWYFLRQVQRSVASSSLNSLFGFSRNKRKRRYVA